MANLAAEETFVPIDRFGSASFDERKLGMERVKEQVILSARGDDAWYSQDRRSILLNPSVTEGAGPTHVFRIPVRHLGD
jgi:hypothetical protein